LFQVIGLPLCCWRCPCPPSNPLPAGTSTCCPAAPPATRSARQLGGALAAHPPSRYAAGTLRLEIEYMRYGIENNRNWIWSRTLFPVQSSVLDEEVLFSEVVKDYIIPEPYSCRFLSRGDSDIYRVKTAARSFYLKIYRPPKSLELTEAEASFVWALSQSDVPVVKPVHRVDDRFAFQVSAPEGNRPMLLYEEAPPSLPSKLDEEMATAIGEKVALFHNVADRFDASFGLPEIGINTFLDERVYYTRQFLSEQESTYLEEVSTLFDFSSGHFSPMRALK
jgi:hypothetical protein